MKTHEETWEDGTSKMIGNLFNKADNFNKNVVALETSHANNTSAIVQDSKKQLDQIQLQTKQSAKKFDQNFKRNHETVFQCLSQ